MICGYIVVDSDLGCHGIVILAFHVEIYRPIAEILSYINKRHHLEALGNKCKDLCKFIPRSLCLGLNLGC